MKRNSRGRRKKSIAESPEYQKLLRDIQGIIEKARAEGVPIGERTDILACRACGAYEDVPMNGGMGVYRESRRVSEDPFIILDCAERSTRRKNILYCKTTYRFICTHCGALQEEIVRVRFEA